MKDKKEMTPEEQQQLFAELTKQMQAEAIMRAPLWRRVMAYWIDITMYVGIVMIPLYGLQATIMPDIINNYPVMITIMTLVFGMLFVGEALIIPGQTIGKLVMGIKIVSQDGSPISFGRLLMREMIGRFLLLPITFLQLVVYIFTGGRFVHDLLGKSKVVRLKPSKFLIQMTKQK